MPGSTYSTNLKIELMTTGENSGTWGDITNTNLGTAFEQAVIGLGNPDYTSDANLTITITNSNASQAARCLVLNVTSAFGSLTQTRELIVPTIQKQYIVQNNTSGGQSITVKTSAGTGITVPNGRKAHLYVNGTSVIQMFDFVNILGGTIDNTTLGATTASSARVTTLNASGATTLDGTVALGNAAGDVITVPGTIGSNLIFTDNTYDIGASGATRPRNLFLAGAATVGGNLSVGGTLTLTGGVNLNGNVTVGDASTDTLTINSTITSNLIFTDNTYDIGASGATRPRNLFLAGNATIGGSQTLTGALTVDSTTDSSSTTTGSIQTDGGLGVAKALYVGTSLNVAGASNLNGAVTLGDAAADNITVNGTVTSNLLFTDNTYDIGASGATRPRNLYLAGNEVVAGSVTWSGGTANGIVYLNGSKVATTGSALTFSGTTVTQTQPAAANNRYYDLVDSSASGATWSLINRIGNVAGNFAIYSVTGTTAAITANNVGNIGTANFAPSSWASNWNSVQLGGSIGVFGGTSQGVALNSNAYWDGTNYKYVTGTSTVAGQFDFNIAEAGGWAWRIATAGTGGNNITWVVPMRLSASAQLMVGPGPNNAQSYDLGVYRGASDVRLLINSDNGYNAYINFAGFGGGISYGRDGGTGHFRWNSALNLGGTQIMTLQTTGNLYLGGTGGLGAATVSGLYVQSGSYVPGGQVTQLLGYWMSTFNDDNGGGGAGIQLYRVPRGGGVQSGGEVRFYTGNTYPSANTTLAGKFDQNQNFEVNGSYISLTAGIGYNSSADRNIYIGATNDDSVNNGATYQWRWQVAGDATGQYIRLNYYARVTGEVEAFRIGNNGFLFYGGTQNPNASGKGVFNGSSVSGGQGVYCFNNTDTTTSSDAAPATVFFKGSTTTSSSQRFVQFYCGNGPMGGIVGNGAENAQFLTISDEREKTNITPVIGALGRIMQIQVSSFDRLRSNEHVKAGFVAQNVLPIYPEYVVENASNGDDEPRYGITGGMSAGFIAELTAALQELTNEFNAYKASHP